MAKKTHAPKAHKAPASAPKVEKAPKAKHPEMPKKMMTKKMPMPHTYTP